jgi:FAD/FMN-containing dehydrogenase
MATALVGDVIWPTDDKYDASRAVFNAVIDRRPLAILRCHDPSDVRRGIAYARSHDLPLAVKGGGHNVAGNAVCDDGLVLDPRVSQFLLIMFRRRPRLRGRPGFLAG